MSGFPEATRVVSRNPPPPKSPFGRVFQTNPRSAGGDDVRQMADPGDEFVVSGGAHPGGAAADALPEAL